jgi:hypothetical protein
MYEKFLSAFEFDPDPTNPACIIKLMEAPYAGTRVVLGEKLSVSETNHLSFEYHVLEQTEFNTKDQAFVSMLSGIVLALIERGNEKKHEGGKQNGSDLLHGLEGGDGDTPYDPKTPVLG